MRAGKKDLGKFVNMLIEQDMRAYEITLFVNGEVHQTLKAVTLPLEYDEDWQHQGEDDRGRSIYTKQSAQQKNEMIAVELVVSDPDKFRVFSEIINDKHNEVFGYSI